MGLFVNIFLHSDLVWMPLKTLHQMGQTKMLVLGNKIPTLQVFLYRVIEKG